MEHVGLRYQEICLCLPITRRLLKRSLDNLVYPRNSVLPCPPPAPPLCLQCLWHKTGHQRHCNAVSNQECVIMALIIGWTSTLDCVLLSYSTGLCALGAGSVMWPRQWKWTWMGSLTWVNRTSIPLLQHLKEKRSLSLHVRLSSLGATGGSSCKWAKGYWYSPPVLEHIQTKN